MPSHAASGVILKRIHPVSLGKMSAVMSGVIGLFYGFWIAAMILYIPEIAPKELNLSQNAVLATSMVAGLVTPFFMIIFGFVYGLVAAVFYNWLASWVGGIRIDLVQPSQMQAPVTTGNSADSGPEAGNRSPTLV